MAAQRGVDEWREPTGRNCHRTAVVDNELFLWGGNVYQDGRPKVHNSPEKCQFYSSVEVFNVKTGYWEQRTTRGTPPLGVEGYSCVAVRNELYYFGGWCGHGGCYHNSVHTLNTSTLEWRMLAPSTTEGGAPMQKTSCGMVHFTDGEEDHLYVVGGYGHATPSSPQHGAQYQPASSRVPTNEQHIFSLSTNRWSSVAVKGQAPPPIYDFTLTTVGANKAAMFGGLTESTTRSDDLFIVELGKHTVNWTKMNSQLSVERPQWRHAHAASHITGPVFVMIGGYDDDEAYTYYDCECPLLSDVWLCDTNQWKQLPALPDSVSKRMDHSVSVFHLGAHCVWVLVFGGNSTDRYFKADTAIIELIQDTDGVWCLGRVMDPESEEALSNNTEYQERLRKTLLQESELTVESSQRRISEVKEENSVLNDRLHEVGAASAAKIAQAPTTANLMTRVAHKTPTKWYEIGVALDIDTSTLNTMKAQTNDQVRLCIMHGVRPMEARAQDPIHVGHYC